MRSAIMGVALLSMATACTDDPPAVSSGQQEVGGEMAIIVPDGQLRGVVQVNGGTGTLITPDTVLTAAHVVCSAPGVCDGPDNVTVKFTNELATDAPAGPRRDILFKELGGVVIMGQDVPDGGIDEVRVHPLYAYSDYWDVALIRLSVRADTVVHNISPIRVEPNDTPSAGDSVTFAGFGRTLTDCSMDGNSIKRKGLSWINQMLPRAYGAMLAQLHNHNVYACSGDSGGPLLNSAGRVIGVFSKGSWDEHTSYFVTTHVLRNWLSNYACTEFDPDDWDWNFCNDPLCPCGYGQGDCDNDAHCAGSLGCVQNNGAKFGDVSSHDYCDYVFQLSF